MQNISDRWYRYTQAPDEDPELSDRKPTNPSEYIIEHFIDRHGYRLQSEWKNRPHFA